jgi:DNA-binding NtrC family response regulator
VGDRRHDDLKTGVIDAKGAGPLSDAGVRLVVMVHGGVQEFNLPDRGSPCAVGRSPAAHIHINAKSVSRNHARIIPDGEGYLVQDLGSTNGTKVNGDKLADQPVRIAAGDTIVFGEVVAQLRLAARSKVYAPKLVRSGPFEERLLEEAERCVRYGRSLSALAIACDSDDLKRLNQAQSAIVASVRSLDVITQRTSGRFDVLLAECGKDEAHEVAIRVMEEFEARDLPVRVGVATYPDDVGSGDGLLIAAQMAMHGVDGDGMAVAGQGARTLQVGDVEVVIAEPAMVRLFGMVERMAAAPVPILVHGETGSGKEIVAEALHALGPRSKHQLVKLNCAALPEQLLESELFGHVKGAFSGADTNKPGLFEQADGGTLFLDEIGEMAPALQAKLLRVLEDKKVRRVGAVDERKIDVRFVAATHRDLKAAVADGSFRQDLYFRLSAMVLEIPPLRERPRELPMLAERFAAEAAEQAGIAEPIAIGERAAAALRAYDWPGNVRELRNAMSTAVMLAMSGSIGVDHLPPDVAAAVGDADSGPAAAPAPVGDSTGMIALADKGISLEDELKALEKSRIEEALAACDGNQTRAAEYLGMPRRTLVRKLGSLGIETGRRKRR